MGIALAWTEYGTAGPPLIILHGLFGSARNWRSMAQRLSQTYRVYALDLRNHGDSPWAEVMDYAALAQDVANFIHSQGLQQAAVLGHSMGGKAAMVLALYHAELVRSLAVLDIAPVAYSHSHSEIIQAMQALDLAVLKRRGEADAALQTAIPETGIRQFLLQNLLQRDGRFSWRLNLAALAVNMETLIGFPDMEGNVYNHSALFLHGGLSDYVQPKYHSITKRLFPKAEINTIDNAGHWLHADQPQQVLEQTQVFLKKTLL